MYPFSHIRPQLARLLAAQREKRKQAVVALILAGVALGLVGSVFKDVHEISPFAGTITGSVMGWSILIFGLALVGFGFYLMSAPPTPPRQ